MNGISFDESHMRLDTGWLENMVADEDVANLNLESGFQLDVMIACPPCTGFSRANPLNHKRDDVRNGLVAKSAEIALALRPRVILMENARELLHGNYRHHFERFKLRLESGGYRVSGAIHMLTRFGLPQIRERALIVAVDESLPLKTLDALWSGFEFNSESTTVAAAIRNLPIEEDPCHVFPAFKDETVAKRLASIPPSGGSWLDLGRNPETRHLLTNAMRANWESGRIGSYPDVYGRMSWDRPAPTIKRECGHIGNGR